MREAAFDANGATRQQDQRAAGDEEHRHRVDLIRARRFGVQSTGESQLGGRGRLRR